MANDMLYWVCNSDATEDNIFTFNPTPSSDEGDYLVLILCLCSFLECISNLQNRESY